MLALSLATLLAASSGADAPIVSVLYFENASNDAELEALKKGLADLIITDLIAWDGVRVIERTRLEDVLKEVEFQQTKYVDKTTAAKLGKVIGATYLVYGSMVASGKTLVLNARLVRASDGEALLSIKEQDERDKIFDLEQRLVNQLVAQIDSKLSANAQARRKARVPDLDTLIAFGKALDLSDQGKLEEAQAAMRAVVSKAPTFLLGRERQQELLKRFEEYQKKKKDLISGSVLELGKLIDDALKNEAKYDAMSVDEKPRYLAMRMLKGRFLARVLKQHLTSRDEGFRVAKKGSEGKALLAMRDWAENQRRYMAEWARGVKQHTTVVNGVTILPSFSFRPTDAETKLIESAQIGGSSIQAQDFETLAAFVLTGRADDGTSFTVAPTLGSADPKEGKAVTEQLDAEIKAALERDAAGDKQAEHQASRLLEFKASWRLSQGDLDGTIGAYQQILDAFPTSSRANWVEGRIKNLLEGRDNQLDEWEDWQAALKTCNDMKIRVADRTLRRRMLGSGLKALDEFAADLEKACLPSTRSNESAFAQMYGGLAHTAAKHDDCDRYRGFYRKYLEHDGSVGDMMAWAKHYPWCELGDVAKDVTWIRATLDRGWTFDMSRHLVSVLSYDEKVLTIMGSTDGPRVPGGQEESFDLRLERQKDGTLKCVTARWRRYWGVYNEGTCSVTLKNFVAKGATGFDQGTFDASFTNAELANGMRGKVELTNGEFRVRRQ